MFCAFLFLIGLLIISMIGLSSAIAVDYYYHPQCSYCEQIEPFMQEAVNYYQDVNWNLIDISKGSYDITGTPFLVIRTDDDRRIELSGSYEIPSYLQCELNQQSNLNCPTYGANTCTVDSWFIR